MPVQGAECASDLMRVVGRDSCPRKGRWFPVSVTHRPRAWQEVHFPGPEDTAAPPPGLGHRDLFTWVLQCHPALGALVLGFRFEATRLQDCVIGILVYF